jgi:hypothetical protein
MWELVHQRALHLPQAARLRLRTGAVERWAANERRKALEGWINPRLKPKLPFHGAARPLADSEDELRELLAACRMGRLSDVAGWIEAGRPLQIDPVARGHRHRATALTVAIESGQHDLVRLLLAGGYRADLEPFSPFDLVLRDRRWDLLELLLEAGADPTSVDPDAVFDTYSREVMDRFWALGADLAGDGAMAAALAHETRNRALYGFVKNRTDDPPIQREVDVALGYAIGRQNEKAVSLCLWAGANPRQSVPIMGGRYEPSDDWTMTAFERAVWEKVPQYLRKLGFDPASDDIEALYEVAYHVEQIEALAKIQPPADWHPITERILDGALLHLDLGFGSQWRAKWDVERVFQLGGHLRALSDLTLRRLRKCLKSFERDEARRWLRLLEQHTDSAAYLGLIGHPMFIEDYQSWGLKRKVVEALAEGQAGSKAASAAARRVLKAEKERPPRIQVPWNLADYIRVTREELYDLVWSAPIVTASRRYGLSDNGLRKICKKLRVPTPPRGYWAERPQRKGPLRLPAAKEGWPTEAWLRRPADQ